MHASQQKVKFSLSYEKINKMGVITHTFLPYRKLSHFLRAHHSPPMVRDVTLNVNDPKGGAVIMSHYILPPGFRALTPLVTPLHAQCRPTCIRTEVVNNGKNRIHRE